MAHTIARTLFLARHLSALGPVDVRQIEPLSTRDLRERVLWPGQPEKCVLPEDNDLVHFGAFVDDALVGCISLNLDKSTFRKLCVDEPYRRRGLATALIERADAESRDPLGCDARLSQADFYRRRGFLPAGDPFVKYPTDAPDLLYVTMRRE